MIHRLLVVDDEAVVREVLCKLLASTGRELVAVEGYDQALAAAAEGDFEAALIDKNLIGRSGLTLTRALRATRPELQVILMSGYASLESALEAVQLGCFEYVTKPIEDFAALELKVQNAIEKARLMRRERELSQRLMESELRYRTLFEATPDALLVCDTNTRQVVDANPAARLLYGLPAQGFQRLPVRELVPEAGGPHVRRDGTRFPAEVTRCRFELSGRPLETLSVRDVSEREAAVAGQRELEARLRQAQKLDALGRLACGAAHDFNGLLALVAAHADLLSDRLETDPEAQADLQGIREAARRGSALTRQLLLFGWSKPVESAPVDLNALVGQVRTMLDRVLGKDVELRTRLQESPWPVRGDQDQLSQVLVNLAVNARDAMPNGGVIEIASENIHADTPVPCHGGELPAGRWVRLSVRDTGAGMPPEVLARLFEPFFTTKGPGRGTGLGLATVFGIVRGAGGGMTVTSTPGEGSTFAALLPIEPAATAAVRSSSVHATAIS